MCASDWTGDFLKFLNDRIMRALLDDADFSSAAKRAETLDISMFTILKRSVFSGDFSGAENALDYFCRYAPADIFDLCLDGTIPLKYGDAFVKALRFANEDDHEKMLPRFLKDFDRICQSVEIRQAAEFLLKRYSALHFKEQAALFPKLRAMSENSDDESLKKFIDEREREFAERMLDFQF